jgi:GNAT superfamily N-acetyltransferase
MVDLATVYENIRDFYCRTFWQWRDAVTEYGDGYVLNYSGLSWLSGANQLWIDDPQVITPRLLSNCVRFFRPYYAEWSIVVIPQVHVGLRERCLNYGCFVRWDSPIMLLDKPPRFPYGLKSTQIVRVRNEPLISIAQNIMGEAFHMDRVVNQRLVRPEHASDDSIHHYMAFMEGHPAAAATMTYTDQMAGIWNVGTRRIFRNRGLASALMAKMCSDAHQEGYTQSVLMASSMGRTLYEKMGYHTIAEVCYLGYSVY